MIEPINQGLLVGNTIIDHQTALAVTKHFNEFFPIEQAVDYLYQKGDLPFEEKPAPRTASIRREKDENGNTEFVVGNLHISASAAKELIEYYNITRPVCEIVEKMQEVSGSSLFCGLEKEDFTDRVCNTYKDKLAVLEKTRKKEMLAESIMETIEGTDPATTSSTEFFEQMLSSFQDKLKSISLKELCVSCVDDVIKQIYADLTQNLIQSITDKTSDHVIFQGENHEKQFAVHLVKNLVSNEYTAYISAPSHNGSAINYQIGKITGLETEKEIAMMLMNLDHEIGVIKNNKGEELRIDKVLDEYYKGRENLDIRKNSDSALIMIPSDDKNINKWNGRNSFAREDL